MRYAILIIAASAITAGTAAQAGDMRYTFTNPAFAGGPAAASHLLGVANAINDHQDPRARSSSPTPSLTSPSELFARQLESRLLSQLGNQVVDAIFGENPQDHGEIVFGDQTITFNRGLEAITITIVDASSGQTTEVSVPTLQTN